MMAHIDMTNAQAAVNRDLAETSAPVRTQKARRLQMLHDCAAEWLRFRPNVLCAGVRELPVFSLHLPSSRTITMDQVVAYRQHAIPDLPLTNRGIAGAWNDYVQGLGDRPPSNVARYDPDSAVIVPDSIPSYTSLKLGAYAWQLAAHAVLQRVIQSSINGYGIRGQHGRTVVQFQLAHNPAVSVDVVSLVAPTVRCVPRANTSSRYANAAHRPWLGNLITNCGITDFTAAIHGMQVSADERVAVFAALYAWAWWLDSSCGGPGTPWPRGRNAACYAATRPPMTYLQEVEHQMFNDFYAWVRLTRARVTAAPAPRPEPPPVTRRVIPLDSAKT